MEPSTLTQFYNDLKRSNDTPVPSKTYTIPSTSFNGSPMGPAAIAWRTKAAKNCENLKDQCRKHIILDIYAKVLPLDSDYIDGHHGQMCSDVDKMLACKGMTPTQYLTSCSESTGAPFVDYLMWATDKIGQNYMEKEEQELKKAQNVGAELAEPEEPNVDDPEVQGQLVDIKQDPEYTNFIDKLKEKTIKKIVSDISAIIADKKEEKDMTFDTASTEEIPSANNTEPAGEPAQESVYSEATIIGGTKVKSELAALDNLTRKGGTIGGAAKKLVNLDKTIRKNFVKNFKSLTKAENANRSFADKIPKPDIIWVKVGDDEKIFKSFYMKSTNTKAAAKRFIKSLVNEYKTSPDKKWSNKCRIWIIVQFSTSYDSETDPHEKKHYKKIDEIINDTINKSLDEYIKKEIIVVKRGDFKGSETEEHKGTTKFSTPNPVGIFPGLSVSFTTTVKYTTYVYMIHLNMKYIFDGVDPSQLEKFTESVEFDSYFEEPKQARSSYGLEESSISVPFDYINQKLWDSDVDFTEEVQDQVIGMAIREATMHEMDLVFRQPRSNFNEYKSAIRFGKGYVVNENCVKDIKEKCASCKNEEVEDEEEEYD